MDEPAPPAEAAERDWDEEETRLEQAIQEKGDPRAARSDEQTRSDYEQLSAEFEALLASGDVHGDDVFMLFSELRTVAFSLRETGRIEAWLDRLESEFPEAYESFRGWYCEYRVADAGLEGNLDALRALKDELARLVVLEDAAFFRAIDLLAWRGYTSFLAEVTQASLALLEDATTLTSRESRELKEETASYACLRLAEESPHLEPGDPDLQKRLPPPFSTMPVEADVYLEHLLRGRVCPWTLEELDLNSRGARKDVAKRNLSCFTVEFLGHLHRVEGVPYTKGEMARTQLLAYLSNRYPESLPGKGKSHDRGGHASSSQCRPVHPLCPDRSTLEDFLGEEFASQEFPRYYRLAALMEIIPAWLRFLQAKGFLDQEEATRVLLSLRGLYRVMLNELALAGVDPAVSVAIREQQECLKTLSRSRSQVVAALPLTEAGSLVQGA